MMSVIYLEGNELFANQENSLLTYLLPPIASIYCKDDARRCLGHFVRITQDNPLSCINTVFTCQIQQDIITIARVSLENGPIECSAGLSFFLLRKLLFYQITYCLEYSSMRSEDKKLSGFFNKSGKEDMQASTVRSGGQELIKINNRFYLTTTKYSHQYYNAYNGIDIKDGKWIVAYLKLSSVKFSLSGKVKEDFRNSISPRIVWDGSVEINKTAYLVEIHECLGPSLTKMFHTVQVSLSPKELLHLLLELVKLIQKLSNNRYVNGQLSPDVICFDPNPKKNQLYLLNALHLRRKGEEIKPICSKYCSKGSHHGRSLHVKDDLESVIYILADLYTDQSLFDGVEPADYENKKNSLNLLELSRPFPTPFIEFFCSVNDMNLNSDFNFFYWKSYLYKILTPSIANNPYTWMLANRENESSLKQEKQYDFIVSTLVKMELMRKLESEELREFKEVDLETKEKIKGKIIRKIILREINN